MARWVEQDRENHHDICFTQQFSVDVPAFLTRALEGRGRRAIALSAAPGGLRRRGARLRRLAADYEVVLLHIHPYDGVALLALATGGTLAPPVLVNTPTMCSGSGQW